MYTSATCLKSSFVTPLYTDAILLRRSNAIHIFCLCQHFVFIVDNILSCWLQRWIHRTNKKNTYTHIPKNRILFIIDGLAIFSQFAMFVSCFGYVQTIDDDSCTMASTVKWRNINTTSINIDDQTKIANDAHIQFIHTHAYIGCYLESYVSPIPFATAKQNVVII